MYTELKKNKIKIPAEMSKNLMILHSYILVKVERNRRVTSSALMSCSRMLVLAAGKMFKELSRFLPSRDVFLQ